MSKSDASALILIDFQHDFLAPDGRLPVARGQAGPALGAAASAIAAARQRGDHIIAVGNEFRPGDWFMNILRRHASIAGTKGAAWTVALPRDGIPYFPKWAGSAFVNPEFEECLKANGITTLVLAGVFARACVSATARDALARGYTVKLLADAIACASAMSRERALARLVDRGAELVDIRSFCAHGNAQNGKSFALGSISG